MTLTSHPYRGLEDLQKMKDLVTTLKGVYPYSSYHIGDLDWWVFYDTSGEPRESRIRLWENERGEAAAWTFNTLKYNEFNLVVHPDLRDSPEQTAMLEFLHNQMIASAQSKTEDGPRTVSAMVDADDVGQIRFLESQGYVGSEYIVYFAQSITGELPEPCLPDGFTFLPIMHEAYAEKRADVHANSFNPSRMTPAYYRGFMQAPNYDPELDTVVVAPDGLFVAFAMGWTDPVNKIGVFEPVGTRNIFQRKGLGKAVLQEGMRRLQARGMEISTVGCNADSPGNLAFYRSAGYEIASRLLSYHKQL